MAANQGRRPRFSSRPLYTSLCILTLLATYSLFLGGPHLRSPSPTKSIFARASDEVCDNVHNAVDQCAFVKANCAGDEPGLLSYLSFYYCVLPKAKPVAFALLALWLGLLFSTIGIAASDFFSVNLSTIASVLGLPESLAGVTFLAFGNGSPDVFSTFAAMGSNSGSMAVGELIGAAGFISAVVAGSMALVREFKVSRKTFVRDIVFFILAVSFTMLFLLDGKMHLWECGAMIGFYVFYVIFVFAWQWVSARRRRRKTKEAASRSHYSVASIHVGDDVEPYHDDLDEDEEDGRVGQRRRSENIPDISALDATPVIDIDGRQDDDDEDRERHFASEMTSSMRVNRPRGRRTHSTVAPIRPSLVGALEFRSVLSSLTRSRNMRLAPLQRGYSDHNSAGLLARSSTDLETREPYRDDPPGTRSPTTHVPFRDRALSSGDVPRHLPSGGVAYTPWFGQSRDSSCQPTGSMEQGREGRSPSAGAPRKRDRLLSVARRAVGARERAPSPATSSIIDGRLAPPDMIPRSAFLSPELVAEPTQSSTPALSLQIPSPKLHPYQNFSQNSSPSLSPFPGLYESPIVAGQQSAGASHPMLPTPGAYDYDHIPGLDPPSSPRPIRWWPYRVLPPPHVLWRTLLPTLQGWRDKSIFDKIFSIFSIPNVFLLVITLPVVETDASDSDDDHDAQSTYAPSHAPSGPGVHAPPVAVEDHANVIHETEWQEYRRRARSFRSRSSSASGRKVSVGLSPEMGRGEGYPFPAEHYGERPTSEGGLGGSEPISDDEPASWNRWLAAVQIFMGPLFTCFIIWAKYMDQPFMVLVKMILYSLVGSLILLAVLLLSTSPDTKPKYYFLFCYLGFVIAIAWISTIAEEVVGILKAVGVILGMSEAILGLTIFAVGNSVGDLVADITVARLGYPVMALSACFGGPMLNILLGIGLGGTYMTMKNAKHEHKKHPNEPLHYGAYHIEVSGTLFISAMTVLATLITLLILVPSSKWMMTRKIGFTLITLWIVGTVANVAVEISGAWKAVA
ncbi:hypothetical protein N0V93_003799 [Gnomoniopsis smithogilvyi]|uniref:Sodium/calcium exchanger membrane region domain-containing protein n=1 Tax=Gnomoniopsis smithogilvyi TaxID=1191159 RepID=A0A9W8Z1G6_9PEZI|nr:hypothetical protein N0V93_003799 [Gnomoniopsis smithogilvyi]